MYKLLVIACLFLAVAALTVLPLAVGYLLDVLDGGPHDDPFWAELEEGSVEFSHALEEAAPEDRPRLLRERVGRARAVYMKYGRPVPDVQKGR